MARDLEGELGRLARTVRRRVILSQPRHGRPAPPIELTLADRLALAWDRTGGRVLLWWRRVWRA